MLAELVEVLEECAAIGDPEIAHAKADAALLDYINDPEVREAFEAVEKWYA